MSVGNELTAFFRASSVLHTDALFLYDRISKQLVLSDIRSQAIKDLLSSNRTLLDLIALHNHFSIEDISRAGCWTLASSLSEGRLSINICLDKKRMFYVNLQVVVVDTTAHNTNPHYLLCSVQFSSRREEDVVFIDRSQGKLWQYDYIAKAFRLLEVVALSYNELEVIRLSRMGYTEREISSIIHKSPDTIRYHKRNIYDKLGVNSLQECISFCETYYLLH